MVGDEIASSPYYMVGWIGFSCIPVAGGIADIRDAVQAIINGDAVGAAMNAAGALPGPGDGVKVTGAVACFTGKYPWKAKELGVLLSKEIMPHLPDSIKIDVWNVLYDGAASRLIKKYDLNADDVSKLTTRGVDLSEVTVAVKVGDDVVPVLGTNLEHAIGRHVDGTENVGRPGTTIFPTSEPVTSYGIPYPGSSSKTPEQIKEKLIPWIEDALKADLTEWPKQRTTVKRHFSQSEIDEYGISEVKAIVYGDVGVETVFASKGPQVFRWYKDCWNPAV
ncbi:hypothetical protein J2129_001869 [Methanofollis sp. W23]|uniref:hypothetical protein n=1 Tax=Methanofollis sp. W23 TaxID=2817849 RepID=UPI001AE4A40B|nr:hypothetical protein [Methanofollis sp. W23]MBP2146415.1 hypothetical protein [Methanofollis sp. W23]